MKSYFILLTIAIQLLFLITGTSQVNDKAFHVSLKKQTRNIPFKPKGACSTTLYNGKGAISGGYLLS